MCQFLFWSLDNEDLIHIYVLQDVLQQFLFPWYKYEHKFITVYELYQEADIQLTVDNTSSGLVYNSILLFCRYWERIF